MSEIQDLPQPDAALHRIRVRREGHEWVFTFALTDAGAIARRAVQLAHDPAAPFDDYDALLVARHLEALVADRQATA